MYGVVIDRTINDDAGAEDGTFVDHLVLAAWLGAFFRKGLSQ